MTNFDKAVKAVRRSPLGEDFLVDALELQSRLIYFDMKQSKELRNLAQVTLTYLGENTEGEH